MAKPAICELICNKEWIHPGEAGFFLMFNQGSTGALCICGELGTALMYAMTTHWKVISRSTTDITHDERFRHIKHTNMLTKKPTLLDCFRLEIKLDPTVPKGIPGWGDNGGHFKCNEGLLLEAAFLPRQFTVVVEKGNFGNLHKWNVGGRRQLRMTFDTSPYPAREAYRDYGTSNGPPVEEFYDWLSVASFYTGTVPEELTKARATDDDTILGYHTSRCVVS